MPTDKKDFLYDSRVLLRNLEKGAISQKEYDKFMADLEDVKNNVAKDSEAED